MKRSAEYGPSNVARSGTEIALHNSNGTIDISKLKGFAVDRLRHGSVLREVLITEDSQMDIHTFLARLPLYLRLSRVEERRLTYR
jgi:hypothetical protein